jgi:hypothetical protein
VVVVGLTLVETAQAQAVEVINMALQQVGVVLKVAANFFLANPVALPVAETISTLEMISIIPTGFSTDREASEGEVLAVFMETRVLTILVVLSTIVAALVIRKGVVMTSELAAATTLKSVEVLMALAMAGPVLVAM